jgi:hypothetical protein
MRPEARTSLAASLPALRMTLLFAGVLVAATRPLAGAVLWAFAAATVVASVLVARVIDSSRPALVATDEPPTPVESLAQPAARRSLSSPRVLEPVSMRAHRAAAANAGGVPRRC